MVMKLREKQAEWPASQWTLTAESVQRSVDSVFPPESTKRHESMSLLLLHREEIKRGRQLGRGAFSEVFEITAFGNPSNHNKKSTPNPTPAPTEIETITTTAQSRYVMKHVKPALMSNPEEFQLAARDLAIEANFLSSCQHDNILKLRGLAANGLGAYESDQRPDGYFLILDQLQDTLDQRMTTWRNQSQTATPITEETPRNYSEALRFASQMASAVSHLHARKIINRDLKPENVGIDAFGNVQMFDFGFCRSLPPQSQSQSQSEKDDGDENDTFLMTGRIGTLRYMAPEVALLEPYNLKADVYSWSVILWEMLSLQYAYKDVPLDEFLTCICQQGRRHDLNPVWPRPIRDLIHRIWVNPISKRPTMQQVFCELKVIQKLSEFHDVNKQTLPILLETSPALEMEEREPLTGTTIASTPEQNGSNRGRRIVTREDPAHEPMDEIDKEAPAPADASPTTFFSLEELISGVDGIPHNLREQHLHPDEFEKLFGMTGEEFNEMRQWKRVDAKKKVGLF